MKKHAPPPLRARDITSRLNPPSPHPPSFPYAGLLAAGGIAAWVGPHHSLHSLQAGALSSALLGFAAVASLSAYTEGKRATWATAMSLVVAGVVTLGMGARFVESGKAWPGLAIAGPSALMVLFYVWCLVKGPDPPAPKKGSVAGRTWSSTAKKRQ